MKNKYLKEFSRTGNCTINPDKVFRDWSNEFAIFLSTMNDT